MRRTKPGADNHHLWFEEGDYTTRLEVQFRSLACQVVIIDRLAHELLEYYIRQAGGLPKPSEEHMELAIERHKTKRCSCYLKTQPRKKGRR